MVQNIIVGLCIVLAAAYIINRIRKSFTRKGGCNCGKSDCPYKKGNRSPHHCPGK